MRQIPRLALHDAQPHSDIPDVGPNIIVGVQRRDFALQAKRQPMNTSQQQRNAR